MVSSKSDTAHSHSKQNSAAQPNLDPKPTPLFEQHQAIGGKIVDFGGWALPVNYGSQIEEHHAVRKACGIFDVSHMTVSDIVGTQTLDFLQTLLANDINKITHLPGKAQYSCLLNQHGGVIDDLIVYYINDQHCRIVSNASTNQKVMAWVEQQISPFEAELIEHPELALLAVQGPQALTICERVLAKEFASITKSLKRFQGAFWGEEFVGRTGYTGEDGVELIVASELAQQLWEAFIQAGVQACGLGARDTLRLESGMALYGNDLDEDHSPLDSGLAWTVSIDTEREFIGKAALLDKPKYQSLGIILKDRGVIRGHQAVLVDNAAVGEITSGTFSPSLGQSIGLARVNSDLKLTVGDSVQVAVRDKKLNAMVAHTPFIKNGSATNEF